MSTLAKLASGKGSATASATASRARGRTRAAKRILGRCEVGLRRTAADLEAGEGEPVEPGQEQGVLDGREAPISGRPAVVSGVGACEVAVLHRLEAVAGPHLMVPYHGR